MTTIARPAESVPLGGSKELDEPGDRNLLRLAARYLPLALILLAQSALSIRLARYAFASGDEGRYIYSGHQLIHEFWHGGGSPYYETYFSGAPVAYPVLAAMADYVGGLLAVRLMSLVFMQVATCLLFGITRRWFGYWPAVLAAGLFAGVGLTQDLGAYATYDAMSLMLIAVAAYCATRTGDDENRANWWLLAVPLALLAANATKYMSVLFDPVVIGLAAWQVWESGFRRMALRVAALGLTTVAVLSVAVFEGGTAYLDGVMSSTLNRDAGSAAFVPAPASARTIVADTWDWTGAIIALAAVAVLAAILWRRRSRQAALLGLLLVAGLLVTIEGIHLHSIESMYKHDDFGIWFTCAAAGSVVAKFKTRLIPAIVSIALILASGFVYTQTTGTTYQADDSATSLNQFESLKPYLELRTANYLLGGLSNEDLVYVDHLSIPWYRLFDDVYIKYPIPGRGGDSHGQKRGVTCQVLKPGCMYLEGIAGYRAAIDAHWFAVISMIGEHNSAQDAQIAAIVARAAGYVRLTVLPGPPTWIYAPDFPSYERSLKRVIS
jgi:hypothetical protein